jgi:hypothetical protein
VRGVWASGVWKSFILRKRRHRFESVRPKVSGQARTCGDPCEEEPLRTVSAISGVVIAVSVPLALAAPVPVQTFATAAGVVKVTPIYHAAGMLQAGGDILYIDPAPRPT